MVTERGLTIQEDRMPAPSRQPEPLVVTPGYVEQTVTSLALLQDLVRKVLVWGRDYGPPYEGARTDTLYDPGASLIISAFNSYAGHRRVLYFSNEHGKVAIVLEVPIIQRNTGAEVGSGVASCTVSESKYKYRWIREEDLGDWGYTEKDAEGFKTRKKWEHTEYRIPNPELEELLHTVVTIASKRAEVDGAKSLPGVGSALRELFDKKPASRGQQKEKESLDEESPYWTNFWSGMKTMLGDNYQAKCYQIIKTKSMHDWLAAGKSLADATRIVSEKVEADKKVAAGTSKEQPLAAAASDASDEAEDRKRIEASVKKLGWDAKKLAAYLGERCKDKKVTTIEQIPSDKVNKIAMELADWELMGPQNLKKEEKVESRNHQ